MFGNFSVWLPSAFLFGGVNEQTNVWASKYLDWGFLKKKNQNNLLSILGADEACIPAIATQGVLCSRL